MLRVSSLSYTYQGGSSPALSDVSLGAGPGECLCLTGPSGCGKTTLLLAIKGLLHTGTISGEVAIDARGGSEAPFRETVGLVFQNAESQILCSTVAEEVAFGPENLCVPPEEIGRRVRSALEEVGLTDFSSRNVERLSAGQKQRLAIASVLAMNPRLLLLDEPTAQLDARGKAELRETLKALKRRGYTLLVAEHDLVPFEDLADRFLVMESGRILSESKRIPRHPEPQATGDRAGGRRGGDAGPGSAPAIATDELSLSYPGVGAVLKRVNLSVARGERVHVYGQNGSGKSSLLACMAGGVRPDSGSLSVAGRKVSRRASLFGKVGYLFQNPQRQLFEDTVEEEVAFSLKRLRLPAPEVERLVSEALETCEASHLSRRSPLSLSFGEQHRVALASVLAPRPEVLLLDEPFSGLDPGQRRRLLAILSSLGQKFATAVVMASHDRVPDRRWPDRVLTMENGTLA
jgi:energy-coupling factor transport system ATP-binding protein